MTTLDPATLSGKRHWLRGKDLGAVGSAITTWADQSGLGNDATKTSGTATVTNADPIFAATDSTHYGPSGADGGAAFAIDGNPTSYWTANGVATGWIRLQLGVAAALTQYTIRRRDDIPARNPTAWTFEGSNDGTTFTTLDTRSGITWTTSGETKSFTFTNTTAYLYYRLNVTANGGDTYLSVAELAIGSDKSLRSSAATIGLPSDTVGTSREMWMVVAAISGTADVAWKFGTSANTVHYPYSDGKVYDDTFVTARQSFTPTMGITNTKRLYRVTFTGGVWKAYLDGVEQASVSGLTLGLSTAPKLTSGWSGNFYEVFTRSQISTSDEIAWLIDYFNKEHGLAVAGGSEPIAGITGAIAATLPALTASAAGTVALPVISGALAATLPALTASATGDYTPPTTTGTVSAALPALTASITGTHTSNDQVGTVAATLPALTASIVGDYAPPAITGELVATLPALTGSIDGTILNPVTGTIAATLPALTAFIEDRTDVDGTIAATLPAISSVVVAMVTSGVIAPWTGPLDQGALVQIEAESGPLLVLPAIATPPAAIVEQPMMQQSHILPVLIPDAQGQVHADGTHEIITEPYGVPHIFIGGVDVTYFRDVPTTIGAWSSSEPGGDEVASVDFPQISPWEEPGEGALSWLRADHPVEIAIVTAEGARKEMFAGQLVANKNAIGEGRLQVQWQIEGTLMQPDHQMHRVPPFLDRTDIGTLIPKYLNGVVSRMFAPLPPMVTNVFTRQRGSYSDSEWDYCQDLLSKSWTLDGDQLTLLRGSTARAYHLGWKDRTTVHWTLSAGAPGVDADLVADQNSVVDAIYGRGTNPDGYSWAGWKYPNLTQDTAPDYPFTDPDNDITLGTVDADTDSGDGVSVWQAKAVELGYLVDADVDGEFSARDADAALDIQKANGAEEDGIVGPQTWNATFNVGGNTGTLDGAFQMPLSYNAVFEPNLYAANGSIIGDNPTYDRTKQRRERYVEYGPGITKAEAKLSARAERFRDSQRPFWAGTITLLTDPHEGHRFDMFEGQNVRLLGWRGDNPLLHISNMSKDPNSLEVRLTVDTNARDSMTIASILERDRESMTDTGRSPGAKSKRSRQEPDMAFEFDGESGAGYLNGWALNGGLWSVFPMAISQVGQLAAIDVRTYGSVSRFAIALFGAPIQPSHLHAHVGNPLNSDDPFGDAADVLLDQFGLIEGWGQKGQAAGYYPKTEGSGPLNGRLRVGNTIQYRSTRPPVVWVAVYAANSCRIKGRIYPAPVV